MLYNKMNVVWTPSSYSHLKVDEDGLHVLWSQDLLQRDHVILQNKEEKHLGERLKYINMELH